MRRKSLVVLVFSSSVGIAACSLFVDTSDLENGSARVDGGGASDASTLDASGDTGASKDAGSSDGGLIFSCEADLCEDFDESAMFQSSWSVNTGTGGSNMIAAKGRTLPNAYEATMIAQSDNTDSNLTAEFNSTPAAFRLELDMMFPTNADPMANEADPFEVHAYGTNPSGYSIYVGDFGSQWKLAEYASLPDGGAIDHGVVLVVTPTAATWSHVILESDGSTAKLTIDGVVAATLPLDALAQETGVRRTLGVGWGYVAHNTDPLDVLYDDVSMTFLPWKMTVFERIRW